MLRVTILYPVKPGASFDLDYYRDVHAPLAVDRLGKGTVSFTLETALRADQLPCPRFVAVGHYLCKTWDDFLAAYLPHAKELQDDVKNFTAIVPLIQVSHVQTYAPSG